MNVTLSARPFRPSPCRNHNDLRWLVFGAALVALGLLSWFDRRPLHAQSLESVAVPGRPFGFAAVTFPLAPDEATRRLSLQEENGRAFYPVFSSGRLARLLGELGEGQDAGGERTALFLFTGTEPLRLTIYTPRPLQVELRPTSLPPRAADRLRTRWWREYGAQARELAGRGDYPPLVETYLTSMLGQRLGLRPPLINRLAQQLESRSPMRQTFDLLLPNEERHIEVLQQTMDGSRPMETADQPLPPDFAWPAVELVVDPEVAVEPMASHVPRECFYVRFGSFENFMWLEDLMTAYGGDIGRMVTARGQDARLGDRVRNQLVLPNSALAKLFGGALIADVALIGRDFYLQDGAAIGVLFQARSSTALAASLLQQRLATQTAERERGATLETVKIAGHDVSFLSTPDNRLRSFYASDGDFHLVTSSRAIVERFFEAGQGEGALAGSDEFRLARMQMPLSRRDTIFAFLSTYFFSGFMSPQYQIELQRRMQAVTDLEILQLAQLAAAAEGNEADTIEALIAGGFLPRGFGRGVDGSGPILEIDRAINSLRGARGTFTPIPDISFATATSSEVAGYETRARSLAESWQRLDPVVVGIQRTSEPGSGIEWLRIEANVSPIAEEKYGWIMSLIGPPVTQRVAPRPADIISFQAHVTGGRLSNLVPPHLLFLGVQDTHIQFDPSVRDRWQMLNLLRATPGYLGAWPKPGFLDWLPLRPPQIPPDGFSLLLFNVWRWQGGGYSLLSFHRDVLDTTIPHLLLEDTPDPAQIRVHVGDLSQSKLRDGITTMYFQRAWQTSVANGELLNNLVQQLKVPPDKALTVAEELLDTHLICPLEGKYRVETSPSGQAEWRSTAWPTGPVVTVPPDYRAPLLEWFRGLEMGLTKMGDQVLVKMDVAMQTGRAKK